MTDTQTVAGSTDSSSTIGGTGDETTGHDDDHPTTKLYVQVAIVLSVLTVMEFSTYYIDFGPIFVPMLLGLMAVKFLIIARMFMHLKFDNALFSRLMFGGLGMAIVLYGIALASLAEVPTIQ